MAQHSNNGEDPISNDLASLSRTAQSTTETETSLPFSEDLVIQILITLPVILLLRLKCVCKHLKNLISDPEFVKKHFHMPKKLPNLVVISEIPGKDDLLALYHFPISSVFSTSTVAEKKLLHPPRDITDGHNLFYANVICSCNGILFGTTKDRHYFLWNPCIKKFKVFSFLKSARSIGFGYARSIDAHCIDSYKVVAVSGKKKVSVYTLGTGCWRRIQDIPHDYCIHGSEGIFVSGTINWFADDVIISLDLANESYQMLSLPDFENDLFKRKLGVVSDCLCVFAFSNMFSDVWIMKRYGDSSSWTRYSICNTKMQELSLEASDALYLSADDQMLLQCCEKGNNNMKLVVYDFKTGTLNAPEFQNYGMNNALVYIETLVSP